LQLHGYTRAEIEGQDALAMGVWMEKGERARIIDMLGRSVEVRGVPMRFRKKSGEIYDALYSATLGDWMGARALIATPLDVTELHRAADEIRRLNETLEERVSQRTAELEQSNRELESFSYSVSHDLRAPLRAMSAFSALLAQRPSVIADSEATGYASRVSNSASRMGTVVDALLHFSRLSRLEINIRPVPLGPEVEAIIVDLGQAHPGRRVRWVTGPLPTVRGDPTLLRLVLQNLIENAVKYTARRDEAVIEIDSTSANSEVVVRVKDNGVGFDMQYADKLFGVFERLHADGEFEGTGIGLANARRIVQRHGGRIWFASEPGKGAAFYFALPE
jgi:light-regulated signal transduction histidine kinase (bacteriophytochrome)